ncbi:MAG: PilZ domain-containing protein [Nitrospirae bacterium]|nr:PilZ domain-containing protein [Nitrospirota bacterium]
MSRQVTCPQCRKEGALRSRPQSPREHVAALIRIIPFHCQHCSHRFLACRLGKDGPQHPIDRREHLRIPVRLYLSFSGGKVRGEGTVMDLSLGGCVIKSETQVHVDDIFYLEIAIAEDETPIEVAAMVRSVSVRGIAFKFLRKAQENKRLLTFIQSNSGSTSSVLSKAVEPTVSG